MIKILQFTFDILLFKKKNLGSTIRNGKKTLTEIINIHMKNLFQLFMLLSVSIRTFSCRLFPYEIFNEHI